MFKDSSFDFSVSNLDQAERGRKRTVIEAFHKLELSFEIEKYPDLVERLADTGEHFQDAFQIAQIINFLWPKLGLPDTDREDSVTAAIFHDIGKAGPVSCKSGSALRASVKKLFPHAFKERPKNFEELAKQTGVDSPAEIAKALSSGDLSFDLETEAITFWRFHVDWTFEVLKKAGIDEKIIKIAASHHILENKNPAHLDEYGIDPSAKVIESTDKYHAYRCRLLEIADKVHAVRGRGLRKHSEAIIFLRERINSSNLSRSAKDGYLKIVNDVFVDSEEDLTALLSKKEKN